MALEKTQEPCELAVVICGSVFTFSSNDRGVEPLVDGKSKILEKSTLSDDQDGVV